MKLEKPTRNKALDLLRGISIVAMIIAHTNASYWDDKLALLLWDLGLFAVHAFIFCSAYLFIAQSEQKSPTYDWSYFKKRFLRLLVPYYIFLVFHFAFLFFFNVKLLTLGYVVKNLTLTGGIEFNWLVVLFLQFTVLMPVLDMLRKKSIAAYLLYGISAFLLSIALLTVKIPLNFKFFMWMPWSLVIIAAWTVFKKEYVKRSIWIQIAAWSVILLGSIWYQETMNHSLRMFHNKYPPNIYHISYGVVASLVLYEYLKRFSFAKFDAFFDFLSRNSYSFYFIHILVLSLYKAFFEPREIHWSLFFVIILTVSSVIQYGLNHIQAKFSQR